MEVDSSGGGGAAALAARLFACGCLRRRLLLGLRAQLIFVLRQALAHLQAGGHSWQVRLRTSWVMAHGFGSGKSSDGPWRCWQPDSPPAHPRQQTAVSGTQPSCLSTGNTAAPALMKLPIKAHILVDVRLGGDALHVRARLIGKQRVQHVPHLWGGAGKDRAEQRCDQPGGAGRAVSALGRLKSHLGASPQKGRPMCAIK